MSAVNPSRSILAEHEIEIRVRYQETDAQGHVHHANYLNYFEIGRVELLRSAGYDYRRMESEGLMLVVTQAACQYFQPANYDDLLRLKTKVVRSKGVRITHEYEIFRGDDLTATGQTVIASVDREGKVKRLPIWLRQKQI